MLNSDDDRVSLLHFPPPSLTIAGNIAQHPGPSWPVLGACVRFTSAFHTPRMYQRFNKQNTTFHSCTFAQK